MSRSTKTRSIQVLCLLLSLCLGTTITGYCGAQSLGVKELLTNAGKYSERQVQLQGKVERWVELVSGEKLGSYMLKDNFGDEIQVKTMEAMPQVGDTVAVTGLIIFDGKQNEYYLQSLKSSSVVPHEVARDDTKGENKPSIFMLLTSKASTANALLGGVAIAGTVLILIVVIAVRMKKRKNRVHEVPDFSFDETETIRIDVDGKLMQSEIADERTVVLMPGNLNVTKGPKELEAVQYRITSALTKIGRQESGIDKSSGWIVLPANCATISRHQADLVFKDGVYYIENRSQSNITRVNGVMVPNGMANKLNDKDIISFGEIELTYSGPT